MEVRTVLCPVDFTVHSPGEVEMAVEVCRTFGARLVLHHNVAEIGPGLSRAWDWDATHRSDGPTVTDSEQRLKAMLDAAARSVPAEAVVTRGPLAPVVLSLAEQLPADLVVLASHGRSTGDHASVTERMLHDAPCPILAIEAHDEVPPFRLRVGPEEPAPRVVVPTDLSADGARALAYACDLARTVRLQLDLLHVAARDAAVADARERLEAAVPLDLCGQVGLQVRTGEPAAEIAAHVAQTRPAFVVAGAHARGLLRRFLTRDTAAEMVHRLSCPVWVVPAAAAGRPTRG